MLIFFFSSQVFLKMPLEKQFTTTAFLFSLGILFNRIATWILLYLPQLIFVFPLIWKQYLFFQMMVKIWLLFVVGKIFALERCRAPYLANGRSRAAPDGLMVRFNCRKGFQLMGHKYLHCIQGVWDAETPVCTSTYYFDLNWNETKNCFFFFTRTWL